MEVKKITEKEILAQKTEKGGWTKSALAAWGVPWPPPKGWKKALLSRPAQQSEPQTTLD